jgi:subtilase family serine protease
MVTDIASPQEVTQSGQPANVSWTVRNQGTNAADGSWVDRLYLSKDGTLTGSTLLASVTRTQSVGALESYTASAQVTLPDLSDGNYRFIVVTDANKQLFESPDGETNNQSISEPFAVGHPDLVADLTAPVRATSGTTIPLTWLITNAGTAPTLKSWIDRIYFSTDEAFDSKE